MPTKTKTAPTAVAAPPSDHPLLIYSAAFLAVLFLAFQVYSPALRGQFVFDDLFLTYTKPHADHLPLAAWCGLRPLLGLSFWANYQAAGLNTFPYHVVNVLLHSASAILLFFIVRKLLALAGTPRGPLSSTLAAFASLLFLLHPAQTEAVAYIASRSESLSVLFIFAALCVFLHRPSPVAGKWTALAVLALFACAVATKEHAIALPAVLLLTDYFWNPGFSAAGIRKNWRIYLPLAVGGVVATVLVWKYVSVDAAIGFHIPGLAWYQYFFTQCRAVFAYIGLFLLPIGQTADHDFAVSQSLLDHGALLGLLALIALAAAAFAYRRRYPLAAYGFFVFLVLLAPTSSFIPIRDVFVERRLYLPFLGLALIALEPLRRVRIDVRSLAVALVCVCAAAGYLTWRRAHVWTAALALWEDSARESPRKPRVRIGLGNAYMHAGRCADASREYSAAAELVDNSDFTLRYNRAAAYECLHELDKAADLLRDSIAQNPSQPASYALLGKVLAEQRRWDESLDSLKRAEEVDPNYAPTHAYRGQILASLGQPQLAAREFEACLRIDPNNSIAKSAWTQLVQSGAQ